MRLKKTERVLRKARKRAWSDEPTFKKTPNRVVGTKYALFAFPAFNEEEGVLGSNYWCRLLLTEISKVFPLKEEICIVALSGTGKYKAADMQKGLDKFNIHAANPNCLAVVTVGGDVFKHALGRGRKPMMQSIVGQVMYEKTVEYKPVIALGDIDPFVTPVDQFKGKPFELRRYRQWVEVSTADLRDHLKIVRSTFDNEAKKVN